MRGSREAGITSQDDIVADDHSLGLALDGTVRSLTAPTDCIVANNGEAHVSVLQDVALDRYVIHDSRVATLVSPDGQLNACSTLPTLPRVLYHIARCHQPQARLALEVVLDCPFPWCCSRRLGNPCWRLVEVVATNFNVGRNIR